MGPLLCLVSTAHSTRQIGKADTSDEMEADPADLTGVSAYHSICNHVKAWTRWDSTMRHTFYSTNLSGLASLFLPFIECCWLGKGVDGTKKSLYCSPGKFHAEIEGARALVCVCVCVCVKEREREREREIYLYHTLWDCFYNIDSVLPPIFVTTSSRF